MLEWLASAKELVRTLGVPPWIVLVGLGLVLHLCLNFVLQKPITSAYGLIAPAAIGLFIETYEIWVQYREIGLFAQGNDPVPAIVTRHLLDVLVVLAGPAVLVVCGRL